MMPSSNMHVGFQTSEFKIYDVQSVSKVSVCFVLALQCVRAFLHLSVCMSVCGVDAIEARSDPVIFIFLVMQCAQVPRPERTPSAPGMPQSASKRRSSVSRGSSNNSYGSDEEDLNVCGSAGIHS